MTESLTDRLRRYRKEIKRKDPELYQNILDDGDLTDQDIVDTIDKVESIELQQRRSNEGGSQYTRCG